MKKALIIGGAGFVGGYLIDCLIENKISVYVTKLARDNFAHSLIDGMYNMDVLNAEEIQNVLEAVAPDYIFHLGAQASVSLSWSDPALTMNVNVIGTINLLESVRKLKIPTPRILLIGSGEEYGCIEPKEVPIKESVFLRPGNPYAVSKAAQGMLGRVYSRAYEMDIIMARPFNHIGPKQSPIFVVADFCKQIAEIEKGLRSPEIHVGNLEAKRDFTDVRDVVRCYALLMEKGRQGYVYNIGSGNAVKVRELLDKLLGMSKTPVCIVEDESKMRPSDIPVIEADVSRVTEDTGWRAEIGIEVSLTDTLEYWRSVV